MQPQYDFQNWHDRRKLMAELKWNVQRYQPEYYGKEGRVICHFGHPDRAFVPKDWRWVSRATRTFLFLNDRLFVPKIKHLP